jgi:putative ABC transport system ATP-binding protein
MTSPLELRHVSKTYGSGPTEVHALREVDLTVERGELVAVMGPSGSGKSTLLTIAGSLETPTSGQAIVDGIDLETVSPSDRAKMRRRSIGYVFQDFNLLPGLKAIENVTLPLELDGVSSKPARAAALEAMEELDVADRMHRFPDELSGGERRASRSRGRSSDGAGCCSPTSQPAPSTPSTARASCVCCVQQRIGASPVSSSPMRRN